MFMILESEIITPILSQNYDSKSSRQLLNSFKTLTILSIFWEFSTFKAKVFCLCIDMRIVYQVSFENNEPFFSYVVNINVCVEDADDSDAKSFTIPQPFFFLRKIDELKMKHNYFIL